MCARHSEESGKLFQALTFRSPPSAGPDRCGALTGYEPDWSRVPATSAHARLSALDVPTAVAAARASTAWVWATAAHTPAVAWPSPWPSSLYASAASSSARRKCSGPVTGALRQQHAQRGVSQSTLRSGIVEELLEMGRGLDSGHLCPDGLVLEVQASKLLVLDDDQLDAPEIRSMLGGVPRQTGGLGGSIG